MRILIVEDEVKIRTGISRLISTHTEHIVVGEAKNGKEGLELIERFHPDLVISDIRMPVMDGLEMLQQAVQMGAHPHFVILSGYSEFDYAQKALRYGVDDYLLKPLAPEDVTALLDKIQKLVDKEEEDHAKTTEGLLRDIISTQKNTEENCLKLEEAGVYTRTVPILAAVGYVGNTRQKYRQALLAQWMQMKERYPELNIHYMYLENTQEMILLSQGDITKEEFEKKLKRRVYQNLTEAEQPVWCLEELASIRSLQQSIAELRSFYLYGIRVGYRELLTKQKIQKIMEEEFQYPLQWENRMKAAVCRENSEGLRSEAEAFCRYTESMTCAPRYIRKTYKKMLGFLENVCHEVNPEAYKRLQEVDFERVSAGMVTLGELNGCLEKAVEIILESKDKKEDIRNYAIRRAINYIREHYSENISLDMLAEQLEITPEYLSALFNKEVGINFSTFLKQFRISQAKRLLKGTDYKIYEVAAQVGYNDPKYFNRVFKEEIGVSPGDYRQNN